MSIWTPRRRGVDRGKHQRAPEQDKTREAVAPAVTALDNPSSFKWFGFVVIGLAGLWIALMEFLKLRRSNRP